MCIALFSNPNSTLAPYLRQAQKCEWSNVALAVGFAAFMAIGFLASAGVFHCMGAATAANLSYGMYTGAALAFVAAVLKLVCNRPTRTAPPAVTYRGYVEEPFNKISSITLRGVTEAIPAGYKCEILTSTQRTFKISLEESQYNTLTQAVGPDKVIAGNGDVKYYPGFYSKDCSTAEQIFSGLQQQIHQQLTQSQQ